MQVTTIGLDLGKRLFQVHGVDAAGTVMLRRQLKRRQVEPFFAKLPRCLIGMEACGTAHHWARQLGELGHEVRLIPPAYAKAYVRRNKTDPADAAAICEAVSRPSMRFVPIKSEAEQAIAAVHRVRERLIGQRTMLINALRGHLAEFGVVVSRGPAHVKELIEMLAEPGSVPEILRSVLLGLASVLARLERQIVLVDKQLMRWHRDNARAAGWRRSPGSGRSSAPRWLPGYCSRSGFAAAGISRPGSGWCRNRAPRGARSGWGQSASKATVTCAGC